jgi:hypothetical protein
MSTVSVSKSLLPLFFISGLALAGGPLRCPKAEFSPPVCEGIRQDAIKVGCIDPGTALRLKIEDRFPACVGATMVGDCPCGCFAEDTRIEIGSADSAEVESITSRELFENRNDARLAALEDEAHLAAPKLVSRGIRSATHGDEAQPLVRIELTDGRVLRLTEKHPVLRENGEMITARELTRGDRLVNRDGGIAGIREIGREPYRGQVFNFETNGTTPESHVIVAEGILVGDLAWQNSLEQELGGIAVRK